MIPSFYKSKSGDFTLIEGDCIETLSKFDFHFDMIFADPPFVLSDGGITCKEGKVACVDKDDWDKPIGIEEMNLFNLKWLTACREHLKDTGTIWVSGTYHNIFSVQQQLIKLGFKILNFKILPNATAQTTETQKTTSTEVGKIETDVNNIQKEDTSNVDNYVNNVANGTNTTNSNTNTTNVDTSKLRATFKIEDVGIEFN